MRTFLLRQREHAWVLIRFAAGSCSSDIGFVGSYGKVLRNEAMFVK